MNAGAWRFGDSWKRGFEMRIFVFGSNLAGLHYGGAAKHAREQYGAIMGEGIGRTGDSYAIPTMTAEFEPLSLERIEPHIRVFLDYAANRQSKEFLLTHIGCGIAGYNWDSQIFPFFRQPLPSNITILAPI